MLELHAGTTMPCSESNEFLKMENMVSFITTVTTEVMVHHGKQQAEVEGYGGKSKI